MEILAEAMTIRDIRILAMELRRDTYLSAKGHFCVANRWAGYHLYVGISSTILSVIAGTSLLTGTEEWEFIAGLFALTVSAITALSTFLNPNEHSLNHNNAGTSYLVLSNHARIFYQIETLPKEKPDMEIIDDFYTLANQRDESNKNSPRIPEWALNRAKKITGSDLEDELKLWGERMA